MAFLVFVSLTLMEDAQSDRKQQDDDPFLLEEEELQFTAQL